MAATNRRRKIPFAAGPVILNVQSSLRRATLTDEIVEFGAWRVFARLALGYGHDPNGAGAADPDGRGPFPTARARGNHEYGDPEVATGAGNHQWPGPITPTTVDAEWSPTVECPSRDPV